MLGHASVAITLDTYSHTSPGIHDAAADAMDRLINPAATLFELGPTTEPATEQATEPTPLRRKAQ
jgi:hypothetical protein